MKKPLAEVRTKLLGMAIVARYGVEEEFPEVSKLDFSKPETVSDRDFRMTFYELNLDRPNESGMVAEYIDGKIVFK
jgi:hypothetical protein